MKRRRALDLVPIRRLGVSMVVVSTLLSLSGIAQQAAPKALFADFQSALDGNRASVFANLRDRATTMRARLVTADLTAFDHSQIRLALFPDLDVTIEKTDIGFTGVRSRSWTGRLPGGGSAAFILNGDRISGTISTAKGTFQIFPLGKGDCVVVEQDSLRMPECAVGQVTAPPQQAALGPAYNSKDKFVKTGPSPALVAAETTALADTPTANRVRVLVAYTSDSQNLTSSRLGQTMQELIDLAVVESNQGYANSGVVLRIELACLYETVFNETLAIANDVDRFRNNGDGFMDEVHTLRADYDADMCCLIVDGTDPQYCGWAYAIDYTSYNNMFQATVYSCATGNYTFAHEFGHLQGARHDTDGTLTPFPYGHGYRNGNYWRTIMAVAGTSSSRRLNFWSNPTVNSPISPYTAMGTPINGGNFANDDRSALNASDNTVVNHESTPVDSTAPTGDTVGPDEDGDKVVTGTLTIQTFTANSGSRVQFRAGTAIQLNTGFWARSGSQFLARLAGPLGDPVPAGDASDASASKEGTQGDGSL